MANFVMARSRVQDYAKWKAADDLREAMQNSGVVGKPDLYFLKG